MGGSTARCALLVILSLSLICASTCEKAAKQSSAVAKTKVSEYYGLYGLDDVKRRFLVASRANV